MKWQKKLFFVVVIADQAHLKILETATVSIAC
jgi:hypothetical protein